MPASSKEQRQQLSLLLGKILPLEMKENDENENFIILTPPLRIVYDACRTAIPEIIGPDSVSGFRQGQFIYRKELYEQFIQNLSKLKPEDIEEIHRKVLVALRAEAVKHIGWLSNSTNLLPEELRTSTLDRVNQNFSNANDTISHLIDTIIQVNRSLDQTHEEKKPQTEKSRAVERFTSGFAPLTLESVVNDTEIFQQELAPPGGHNKNIRILTSHISEEADKQATGRKKRKITMDDPEPKKRLKLETSIEPSNDPAVHFEHLKKIKDILEKYKVHLDKVGPLDDRLYHQKQASVNTLLTHFVGIQDKKDSIALKGLAEAVTRDLMDSKSHSPFNDISIKEILGTRRAWLGWHDTGRAVLKGIVAALAYVTVLPAVLTRLITKKSVQSHLFPVKGREVVEQIEHEVKAIKLKVNKSK